MAKKVAKSVEEVAGKEFKNLTVNRIESLKAQYKSPHALARRLEKEDREAGAVLNKPRVRRMTIVVEWRRNPTWGMNPRAYARVWLEDGSYEEHFSSASGWGYDKLSTVVAGVMNDCAKGMAAAALAGCQDAKDVPYGIGGADLKYDRYPYFEGGVGISCYLGKGNVFDFIGLDCRHVEGKTWNHFELTARGE